MLLIARSQRLPAEKDTECFLPDQIIQLLLFKVLNYAGGPLALPFQDAQYSGLKTIYTACAGSGASAFYRAVSQPADERRTRAALEIRYSC